MSRSAEGFRSWSRAPSLLAAVVCGLVWLAAFPLLSATNDPEAPAPIIAKAEVWVDGRPNTENLESLISIRAGDRYSLKTVSEGIKQIYKTGLFSDVQVEKTGEEQVELRFLLTRKLLVRRIRFQGDEGISRRKLNQSLYSLRVDNYFSEDKLRRAVEELKRGLNDEGYFQPRIQPSVRRAPQAAEVDVVFDIAAGVRYLISAIRFMENGAIPETDLRKKMKTRQGDLYSLAELEQDFSRLTEMYRKRGYQRVEIDLAREDFIPETGTVSLVIKIDPDQRIQILIQGAKVPVSLVQPIWEEKIFEDWGLGEGEARILDYLRGKGFIFAAVSSFIDKSGADIRIVHQVTPGPKTRIKSIRFDGLHYFTADEIKEQLGIAQNILFFGALDGKRVFELPYEVIFLYQSQGFPEAQVSLSFLQEAKTVTAVYAVQEGRQQKIATISITGASLFSQDALRTQLGLVEGGPYFPPAVQKGIEKLNAFYLNQAVRGTQIESKTEAVGNDLFRVTLDIREGRQAKVKSLFIAGNIVTQKSTIMRELRVKEGDYAYYDRIVASKANLEKLGVFSEVNVDEIAVSPDEEDVVVTVREGERNYAGLGIGIETKDATWSTSLLNANLRPRGTAEYMRSNIFGLAANLSLVGQFSLSEKRAVISWEQPYFLFHIPFQTYVSAWIEGEERPDFRFNREGVSLTGIRPIFWGLTSLTTLQYARTTLTHLDIPGSEIDREFFPYSKTSLASSLIKEKRNDAFNPEKGYFSSLTMEWAFPLFQTESDFLKSVFKYQRYFRALPRVLLGSTFRLGLGMGKMPIHERFFAGGSNSFRGREFDQLGPKAPGSGKAVGGKALILVNFELAFPLLSGLPDLSGVAFYDAGNVFNNRSDFDLRALEHAVGLGLRYRTPLGPVRLELGWNLSEPKRKGKPLVFITIGHIF